MIKLIKEYPTEAAKIAIMTVLRIKILLNGLIKFLVGFGFFILTNIKTPKLNIWIKAANKYVAKYIKSEKKSKEYLETYGPTIAAISPPAKTRDMALLFNFVGTLSAAA